MTVGKRMFMVDIEATGVDMVSDDILQVAFLELRYDGKYYQPGASLSFYCNSLMQPTSEFAKTHMADIYLAANSVAIHDSDQRRQDILQFFKDCGVTGRATLCGWNASNFDTAMLVADGYLMPPGYKTVNGKDEPTGDFDYHIYELGGAVATFSDAIGIETSAKSDLAKRLKQDGEAVTKVSVCDDERMGRLKSHDAFYDCMQQTYLLNGLLKAMRPQSAKGPEGQRNRLFP